MTANNTSMITARRERLRLRSRKLRNSRILARAKVGAKPRAQAADCNAAETVANLGDGLWQAFPFMKLPAELRLAIYKLAIRSHLEDIERTTFLQLSTKTEEDLKNARELRKAGREVRRMPKAVPYLGVLALLHTSKVVYWESYNIMCDLEYRDIIKRPDWHRILSRNIFEALDRDTVISSGVFVVSLSLVSRVQKSVQNTFPRYLLARRSTIDHGKLNGQAAQSTPSTTNPDGSTESATGIDEDATRMAALKYLPNICAGIQRRIEGGAGVRIFFKAEVTFLVGREITDHDVDIMIKGVAALGASLKIIRQKQCSKRLRSSRVVERKSRAKQHRSSASCDSPRTWLSADEMDTGP